MTKTKEEAAALHAVRERLEEIRDDEARAKMLAAFDVIAARFEPRIHGGIPARCSKCNGVNVTCHVWVVPNTSELGDYAYEDENLAAKRGASFCEDCGEHLPLVWGDS